MSLWVDIAVGTSASATALLIITGALYRFMKHMLKQVVGPELDEKLTPVMTSVNERFDANDQATKDAVKAVREVQAEQQSVKLNLATQFGGNGGGIRQAINDLSVQIGTVKGAFEQHIAEVRSGRDDGHAVG